MNRYGEGEKGEVIAREYLRDKGYIILDENVRYKSIGEIDLIALDKGDLVIVEVKTRSSYDFGDPLLSITPKKIKSLIKATELYIGSVKLSYRDIRFDVIVVFNDEVTHIKEAFYGYWNG